MSAANPADALADKLVALTPIGGVALVKDGGTRPNVFVGQPRPVSADCPARAVFCENQRGPRPSPFLNNLSDFKRHHVLVTVRSEPGQYAAGEQFARDLMAAAHRTAPTGYITVLLLQSGPELRGEDAERCFQWAFEVELLWKG